MFDKIDIHLIRVLNTVLLERSVSRAAIRLGMHQPAVSAALKRLRLLAGDPILVRSGSGMVPTDAGLRMIEPSARILQAAGLLFSDAKGFDPATAQVTFRLAASDYLNPLFLPQLVALIKAQAPACRIDIQPLSADSDYRAHLAQGRVDIVVGNWSAPPDDLHLAACSVTRWCAWWLKTTLQRATSGKPKARLMPPAGWVLSTLPPRPLF